MKTKKKIMSKAPLFLNLLPFPCGRLGEVDSVHKGWKGEGDSLQKCIEIESILVSVCVPWMLLNVSNVRLFSRQQCR